MRRSAGCTVLALILATLVLAGLLCPAAAEETPGLAGLLPDPETGVLDLDGAGIRNVDREELARVIDETPGIKEVWLFDAEITTEDQEWLFERYYPDIFFGFTVHVGPMPSGRTRRRFPRCTIPAPRRTTPGIPRRNCSRCGCARG